MRWSGVALKVGPAGRRAGLHIGIVLIVVAGLLTTGFLVRPPATAVMPDPRPLHGSQPFATLLCRFAGPQSQSSAVQPAAYYDRVMLGGAGSLDDYWQQVSYGAINLAGSKAFGWFQMEKPVSAYNRPDLGRADLDALARDCTAAAAAAHDTDLHFANYVGLNLVFSECIDRSRGGALNLTLDGKTRTYRITWLCPGYASSQQIMAHEMGHSFGLTHSEDSQGAEYGNTWDVMSNAGYCAATTDFGTLAQQPIAYDKDVLGWIAPGDKYTARRSGVVTIQLDYLERQRGGSPGYLMAQIPLPGGRFYTVEARSRSGYDVALPAPGVLIHEIDPRRANRPRLVTGQAAIGPSALLSSRGGWAVGSAFIDAANNVGVSVDGQVHGGFVVTLYTGALPWPQQPELQTARSDRATAFQWTPVDGAQRYELQVSRLGSDAMGASFDWGATFVSDRPALRAGLLDGQYRWRVRALPDGPWSPPQTLVAGRSLDWAAPELVAQVDGALRVAPMVSASANGRVDVAWAQDDQQRSVSVTRAAWQGSAWAVEDLLNVPSRARRGLAMSFTRAGDLKLSWPATGVEGMSLAASPAVAFDAGGRAHTIWAGRGAAGLLSAVVDAVVDAHAPSAGPVATPVPQVRPVPVSDDASGAAKYSPSLALDGHGNAQAVWIDTRDGHAAVYSAAQGASGAWGIGVRLSEPTETVNGRPAIAVDAAGNAYAVWQGSLDCGGPSALAEISFAERPVGGEWQAPITLAAPADGRLIDPVVVANDSGAVYVSWGEAGGVGYRLYAAYRGPSGQWESPRVTADGRTDAGAMSLSLAVNGQGDAYLTWAETRGGQTLVRFAATR